MFANSELLKRIAPPSSELAWAQSTAGEVKVPLDDHVGRALYFFGDLDPKVSWVIKRILRPGDTVVGTVRPGNESFALIAESGITGSTGCAVLRPRRPEYREFVYLAATAQANIMALAALADGGAYPAVRPEAVAQTPVVLPPLDD